MVQQIFKNSVKKYLKRSGYDIVPTGRTRRWQERLDLAGKLGFCPQAILDGGAFKGLWSKEVARLFPESRIVLVEPNPFLQEIIRDNIGDIQPSPTILQCALGASLSNASFNIWRDVDKDSGASLLNHVQGEASQNIQVEVDTIDNIAERLSFTPDLIKLDLQGGELWALQGSKKVLQHVELVIIEFHCLEAYIGCPSPRDLLDYMYDNDFSLYDIVDCYNRPYDDSLAGGDFFFVKNNSKLRDYKGWK